MINLILVDQEFSKLELSFKLIEINTTAARKHIGEIEQSICAIKERGRSISTVLPYTVLPKQVVIHLICYVVMFLNAMSTKTGISDTISPREIVTRHRLDWNKHYTREFGEYVEAHIDPAITNTPNSRTFTGIYLGITGNIQGTKKVLDLEAGIAKKPRSVTVLPMPDHISSQVSAWGKKYQEGEKKNKLEFLNCLQLQYN